MFDRMAVLSLFEKEHSSVNALSNLFWKSYLHFGMAKWKRLRKFAGSSAEWDSNTNQHE